MKNKYILLEMNKKNEIRADIDISIASLGLFGLENVNVKIDTGCPYTSIPIKKLGISSEKAFNSIKEVDKCPAGYYKEVDYEKYSNLYNNRDSKARDYVANLIESERNTLTDTIEKYLD